MDFLRTIIDPYERRAQLGPMLIALAPVIALLCMYAPFDIGLSVKSVAAVLLYGTASTLLATLSRYAGKRQEPALKHAWGGWPSMMVFRHAETHIDPITKANIHQAMAKTVAGTYAPTPQQEAQAPKDTDNVYLAWSEHLRKLARNNDRHYPHVFRESISYGFHRNLFGLKAFALAGLIFSIAVSVIIIWVKWESPGSIPQVELICVCAFVLAMLFWIFAVNPSSVKRAAYDYALRLVDDCVPDLSPTKRKARTAASN